MKKITVEVCVCTQCVLNGSMHIIESIESLKKLKTQLRMNAQIVVVASPCLVPGLHPDTSPLVCVGGDLIEKASSEAVMEKIISLNQAVSARSR